MCHSRLLNLLILLGGPGFESLESSNSPYATEDSPISGEAAAFALTV
jgi:hypothetical protein